MKLIIGRVLLCSARIRRLRTVDIQGRLRPPKRLVLNSLRSILLVPCRS